MMAGVLVVDDSLTVRMDLKQALESAGHTATLTATLAEARGKLAGQRWGLVILDLLLPDGDGIDLLQEIRSNPHTAGTPIMLLSTESEVEHQLRGLSSGADEYLGKPYDREYLIARANHFLKRDVGNTPATRVGGAEDNQRLPAGKRILAVDDSPTYLHGLADRLRREGMEVLLARSGEEALKVLASQPVDVVLLDLVMEGLSGEETCRQIKSSAAWNVIPVLMLTGVEEHEAMVASFNAGADDYIAKSSEFAVLHSRLRAQIRRRDLEEEHRRVRETLHQREVEASQARAQRDLAEARATLLADLEKKNAELEVANHAKDHFLAVLSHELRTPLTPVVATVALLQSTPGLSDDVRASLEVIRRNADLEARLIDDLLDMTRIAKGKVELNLGVIPLCDVIASAVEVCKADIEARQLEFAADFGEGSPYLVKADATRLQQVFWNLLKNAVKFTPHGGCVGIRCRLEEDMVVTEVTDSGEGIARDALLRIFDAFEQAERSITQQFGGLGLGLAISKALVELHGGVIDAHSEGKGKGSTFTVRLPAACGASVEAALPSTIPTAEGVLPTRSLRILFVEDHGDTAKIMKRLLSASGHDVQMAGDVATALDLASSRGFDLLISDLGLPDGSGLDLMRELRQRGITVPGIAVSGYGREDDVRRSRDGGFCEHLTKPVDLQRLAKAIARLGDTGHVRPQEGV